MEGIRNDNTQRETPVASGDRFDKALLKQLREDANNRWETLQRLKVIENGMIVTKIEIVQDRLLEAIKRLDRIIREN